MLADATAQSATLTREEKKTLVQRFLFFFLVVVGLWVAGVGYRDELRRILAHAGLRQLLGLVASLVIGYQLQQHWRSMVSHEWGLAALVYLVSVMACVWTQRSMPWLVALMPPAALRLLDGICHVCGCCRRPPRERRD